jgi:penicillin amidase
MLRLLAFRVGPTHRTVVEARSDAMRAESIWPGGTSGVLGSPNYFQFLERWLTNESVRLRLGAGEAERDAAVVERFVPR